MGFTDLKCDICSNTKLLSLCLHSSVYWRGVKLEKPTMATKQKLVDKMIEEIERLREERNMFAEALERIKEWSEAYPLDIFPEPDFKRANELLQAGGMMLDAISASNMRHVVKSVGEIASAALKGVHDD